MIFATQTQTQTTAAEPFDRVAIASIGYLPKFYPRVNGREDYYTVNIYRSALKANPSLAYGWRPYAPQKGFPPITLVAATRQKWPFLLLDGLHRLRTYYALDYPEIPAVVERLPETKWLARSVELNIAGKRGLDPGDKAYVSQQLEADGWGHDQVAKLLQMSSEELERIKVNRIVKLTAKATKTLPDGRSNREINGRHYGFLKAPFADLAGTASATDALAQQAPLTSRDTIAVLDSAIAVLTCGVDLRNEEIAWRVERIRGLLPE